MIVIYAYQRRWTPAPANSNNVAKKGITIEKSIITLKIMVNYNMIDHKNGFILTNVSNTHQSKHYNPHRRTKYSCNSTSSGLVQSI